MKSAQKLTHYGKTIEWLNELNIFHNQIKHVWQGSFIDFKISESKILQINFDSQDNFLTIDIFEE